MHKLSILCTHLLIYFLSNLSNLTILSLTYSHNVFIWTKGLPIVKCAENIQIRQKLDFRFLDFKHFYHSCHNKNSYIFLEHMFVLSTHFINYILKLRIKWPAAVLSTLNWIKKKLISVIIPASSTVFVHVYYSTAERLCLHNVAIFPTVTSE